MSNVTDRTSAAPHFRAADPPRVELGGRRDTEFVMWLLSRIGGPLSGGGRIRVLEAFGLSPGLFWAYIVFARRVVPATSLSRVDCELATLRTAWDAGARYEWHHHTRAARLSGISPETVERVAAGPTAEGWTPKQRLLLQAVDELHADRMIADSTWAQLSEHLTPGQLVDLCFLVGHYEMLAMMLKSIGVEPEGDTWVSGVFSTLPMRRDDDSDRIGPLWMRGFHRAVLSPVMKPIAKSVPTLANLHHIGRQTGKAHTTPVFASLRDGLVAVPLLYGDKADWVRNILAAGGGEVSHRRRTRKVTNPRVLDASQTEDMALPARSMARIAKVLVLDLAE